MVNQGNCDAYDVCGIWCSFTTFEVDILVRIDVIGSIVDT